MVTSSSAALLLTLVFAKVKESYFRNYLNEVSEHENGCGDDENLLRNMLRFFVISSEPTERKLPSVSQLHPAFDPDAQSQWASIAPSRHGQIRGTSATQGVNIPYETGSKSESSKFMTVNPHFPQWNGWTEGYYANTVDESSVERVRQYIKNQKTHHKNKSFEEELDEFWPDRNDRE